MRWIEHRLWCWWLANKDGRIVAQVTKGIGGPWTYNGAAYINLESAKKAAEKTAIEKPD